MLYARAYTSEHQYELLDFVAAKFHEEAGVFKLLVRIRNGIFTNLYNISKRNDYIYIYVSVCAF